MPYAISILQSIQSLEFPLTKEKHREIETFQTVKVGGKGLFIIITAQFCLINGKLLF